MRRTSVLGVVAFLLFGAFVLPAQAQDYDATVHLVRDLRPGGVGSAIVNQQRTGATLGSLIVFGAYRDGGNSLPWVSDGTHDRTKVLSTVAQDPLEFVTFKGRVYFSADSLDGRELWQTDGTPAGTTQVLNLDGAVSSDPKNLTVVGDSLYYSAKPTGTGQELYKLSAPPAIGPPAPPVNVSQFGGTAVIGQIAAWGSKVLFASSAGGTGSEPWISDGTNGGTFLLRNIEGSGDSSPTEFTPVGGYAYFSANEGVHGTELWRTDGTGSAGTTLVADLEPSGPSSSPHDLFASGGELLFAAHTSADGYAVWASDGSAAGTQILAGIRGGGSGSNPTGWTYYKGYVYFSGSASATGAELWRTKGGPLSTSLVKNIDSGTFNSSPQEFRVVDGVLYFQAEDVAHGAELWRSNGTSSGTKLVKDIKPGTDGSFFSVVGVVSNTLFLDADDGVHGDELWAYTTRASTTKGSPKSSYSTATAAAKHIDVTVKVTAAGVSPIGTVVLKKGSTVIGKGTLAAGKVTIRIGVKLAKGTTSVRAYYSGSVRARSSVSSPFSVKVS